jgi:hypothetical protein
MLRTYVREGRDLLIVEYCTVYYSPVSGMVPYCYIPPLAQVGVVDASHKPVRETAAEKREREEIKVKGAAASCNCCSNAELKKP